MRFVSPEAVVLTLIGFTGAAALALLVSTGSPAAVATHGAESPPDSIVWLPPTRVHAAAMGPFDTPMHIPDGWRIEARIWTVEPSHRLFVALTREPDLAPDRLPDRLTRRLFISRLRRPRPPVGAPSFTDTLGCRFIVMRGFAPRAPVQDSPRRVEMIASVILDSATVAAAGPWVTAFDAAGRRNATFRLEGRP